LQSPHRLGYLHRMPGKAEVRIEERFDGASFTASVKGWSRLGSERWEVELASSGGTQGVNDHDGGEAKTRYSVTGTLRGAGAEVDVQEQHAYSYASAVSLALLHSQRGWASQFQQRLGSTLRAGGSVWRFASVQVETQAKEKGGQRSDDVVATSGTIVRDDQPFAAIQLQGTVAVAVVGNGAFPLQVELPK
jgi:hypothetical protein